MFERLSLMEKRYEEINNLLMDPKIVSNISEMTKLLKEQKSLEKAVLAYRKYIETNEQIESLEPLIDGNDELAEMAILEKHELEEILEKLHEELRFYYYQKIQMMKETLLLRLKELQVVMKEIFRRIYLGCILIRCWKIGK